MIWRTPTDQRSTNVPTGTIYSSIKKTSTLTSRRDQSHSFSLMRLLQAFLVVGLTLRGSLTVQAATTFALPNTSATFQTAQPTLTLATWDATDTFATATDSQTTTATASNFSEQDPILDSRRTVNMLADIKGIYSLPQQGEVVQNKTLNVTDIQGDILIGMKKKLELFYFFSINEPKAFKKKLHTYVVPRITSTFQLLSTSTQPIVCLNLAFTRTGLVSLGITANLGDTPFNRGQFADASNLGDVLSNWISAFAGTKVHGVFLIASDSSSNLVAMVKWLETLFGTDMTKLYTLQGNIRPPPNDGHEMFGFLDGIGQPAVAGFNLVPAPGQQVVSPGVILTGEPGDSRLGSRPKWAKDGSFLVFRQLKQLVPEFNKFLLDNAPPAPTASPSMTLAERAELLGARIVGRWKSGAPVDLTPLVDNPTMGANPLINNKFDFSHTGFNINTDQTHCPFAAHIRKTRPRADLSTPLNAIMRAGIPYGPELSRAEAFSNQSSVLSSSERGLAFVSYQSNIDLGFQFIQTQWANAINFAPGKNPVPGFDLIFGQNAGATRWMSGADIDNPTWKLKMLFDHVISRGGEYFFSPSISAIRDVISV